MGAAPAPSIQPIVIAQLLKAWAQPSGKTIQLNHPELGMLRGIERRGGEVADRREVGAARARQQGETRYDEEAAGVARFDGASFSPPSPSVGGCREHFQYEIVPMRRPDVGHGPLARTRRLTRNPEGEHCLPGSLADHEPGSRHARGWRSLWNGVHASKEETYARPELSAARADHAQDGQRGIQPPASRPAEGPPGSGLPAERHRRQLWRPDRAGREGAAARFAGRGGRRGGPA